MQRQASTACKSSVSDSAVFRLKFGQTSPFSTEEPFSVQVDYFGLQYELLQPKIPHETTCTELVKFLTSYAEILGRHFIDKEHHARHLCTKK